MSEHNWDFDEQKHGSIRLALLVLYGILMAFIGGSLAYLLFSFQEAENAVPALAVEPTSNHSDLVVRAVEKGKDAVVGIVNLKMAEEWGEYDLSGSGVVFAKKGNQAYIATNYHVVEGTDEVEVVTSQGTKVKAEIVGYDPLYDLAVLSVPSHKIRTVAQLGDSDQVRLGETVIAVGNPLGFAFSETVTVGVVSGKNRKLPVYFDDNDQPDWEIDVIQTDAAINFGNSGGALLNLKGEVVGINIAKVIEEGVESIGFSIPVNVARPILEEILEYGKVRRPYLGIVPVDLTALPEDEIERLHLPPTVKQGVVVGEDPEGPAKEAGLMKNDVIVSYNHIPVRSQYELRKLLYSSKIGEEVKLTVYRLGNRMTLSVILGDTP